MDAEFHSARELAMLATIRALSGVGAHVVGTDALIFFLAESDFILLNTRLIYLAPTATSGELQRPRRATRIYGEGSRKYLRPRDPTGTVIAEPTTAQERHDVPCAQRKD
jgi:hypothetical protein